MMEGKYTFCAEQNKTLFLDNMTVYTENTKEYSTKT